MTRMRSWVRLPVRPPHVTSSFRVLDASRQVQKRLWMPKWMPSFKADTYGQRRTSSTSRKAVKIDAASIRTPDHLVADPQRDPADSPSRLGERYLFAAVLVPQVLLSRAMAGGSVNPRRSAKRRYVPPQAVGRDAAGRADAHRGYVPIWPRGRRWSSGRREEPTVFTGSLR